MGEDIAIVGLACRYPDANSPIQLWENVLSQRRSFRRIPASRLRAEDYLCEDRGAADATYSWWAAVLQDYEFDRSRYRIPGSTYRATDLAHWLALDVASDCLADAGFPNADGLPGDATGVVVGNTLTGEITRSNVLRLRWPFVRRVVGSHLRNSSLADDEVAGLLAEMERSYKAPFPPIDGDSLAGGLSNTIAGRICNFFDLNGGGWVVDGACASSLLALTTVCGQLVAGEIDVGLAGGVDISIDPFELVGFAKTGALSSDEMRVYDRRSAGFWPGEGCGFALLMRAADASAQRRHIYAHIRGWGVSSDGAGGMTRPDRAGQALALHRSYRRAGVDIGKVAHIEGHGTGTPVGDEVELEALAEFSRRTNTTTSLAVGSVKANIGHTKAAAGMAGLIKTAMALHAGVLPPHTGCEHPHPLLAEPGGPLRVVRRAEPWPEDQPLAGVSGMGFGGVNAHVVLEVEPTATLAGPQRLDARTRALARTPQDAELFLFAAKDRAHLQTQLAAVGSRAGEASWGELGDLAATLAATLAADAGGARWRLAIVASTPSELVARIGTAVRLLSDGGARCLNPDTGTFLGGGETQSRIGYLFPGQGVSASRGGGAWSRRFAACAELYSVARLDETDTVEPSVAAQAAIATASLAGLAVLSAVGMKAELALGHSLGELCAYQWAGAMSPGDLIRLTRGRGEAMACSSPPGTGMVSLAADLDTTRALLVGTSVVVAAINGPLQVVVAGPTAELAEVMRRGARAHLGAVRLPVQHAFHSPLMGAAAELLDGYLKTFPMGPLRRRVVSTITGEVIKPGADLRGMLVRHVTAPVRFHDAMVVAEPQVDVLFEVGPGRVLTGLVDGRLPCFSLDVGGESLRGLLGCVGAAYALGAPLRVRALFDDRILRPFRLDRPPAFLANPCEQVSADAGSFPAQGSGPVSAPPACPAIAAGSGDQTRPGDLADSRQLVLDVVARHAELPSSELHGEHRFLDDLHMSSITVGQIVQETLMALGLSPSITPTSFANATIDDLCAAIVDLLALGGGKAPAEPLEGVAPWVRAFGVVERRLPSTPRAVRTTSALGSEWAVLAEDANALAGKLGDALRGSTNRHGVAVCLTPGADRGTVDLLVRAARQALSSTAEVFLVVQRGAGGSAFARSVSLEAPRLVTCVVDIHEGIDDATAAELVAAEVRAAAPGVRELRLDLDGTRWEPGLALLPGPVTAPVAVISPGDVLLITGGAQGIGVECASWLGQAWGAGLALVGRSSRGQDRTLDDNLARLASEGLRVCYTSADVGDAAQVHDAVATAERALGPVTAVIHAAGVNTPTPASELTTDQVMATLRPKVDGLRNVVSAVDPHRLKLLVAFGSLIARTGFAGEAHYGLANEWLAQEVEHTARGLPHCRCLTLEWSVWTGAGMAERLGVVEALTRAGIRAMPRDQAITCLTEVLTRSDASGPIIISDRFGKAAESALRPPEVPLLRFLEHPRVHYPGVELVVDVAIDAATDPYFEDHVLDGHRVMPAALQLEAMAQAVRAISDRAGATCFHDIEFNQPLVLPDGGGAVLRIALLVADNHVHVTLRSDRTDFLVDHARAVCPLAEEQEPPARAEPYPARVGWAPAVDVERDLYGTVLFQAGRFRRLRRFRGLEAAQCLAEIEAREDRWFGPFLPNALVFGDPGLHDAALHCVQACIPQIPVLPVGAGRFERWENPTTGRVLVAARERSRSDAEYRFDIDVSTLEGRVCERWTDVRFRPYTAPRKSFEVAESLIGVVIERRVQDLLHDRDIRLLLQTGAGQRRTSSDDALGRILDGQPAVKRNGDGRPHVDGALISAAHVRDLTLAVSSTKSVTCDLVLVEARRESEWRSLLGPRRWQLAQAAAHAAALSGSAGGAVVWAAGECLVKAGLSPDAHLAISSASADHWVVLREGGHHIAATALATRLGDDIAVAVLTETARA